MSPSSGFPHYFWSPIAPGFLGGWQTFWCLGSDGWLLPRVYWGPFTTGGNR